MASRWNHKQISQSLGPCSPLDGGNDDDDGADTGTDTAIQDFLAFQPNRAMSVRKPTPLLGFKEVLDPLPVRPLGVSVHVHLHDASAESSCNRASRDPFHRERQREADSHGPRFGTNFWKLAKNPRCELHVARLVHAVDVAESGSNGEHLRDGRQSLPHLVHILGVSPS